MWSHLKICVKVWKKIVILGWSVIKTGLPVECAPFQSNVTRTLMHMLTWGFMTTTSETFQMRYCMIFFLKSSFIISDHCRALSNFQQCSDSLRVIEHWSLLLSDLASITCVGSVRVNNIFRVAKVRETVYGTRKMAVLSNVKNVRDKKNFGFYTVHSTQ